MTHPSAQALADIDRHIGHLVGRIARREVLCAAAGLKPVRLMASEHDAPELLGALRRAGLFTATSRDPTWIAQDEGKGGWSSACAGAGQGEPFRHVYVARTQAVAEQLKDAEESGSPETFGRLLLVPACCRRMFMTCSADAAARQNDYLTFSFVHERCDIPWQLNLGAQYFDAALVSHYPCAPSCADSIRLASLSWRIILHAAPGLAQEVRFVLTQPVLYTEREGVHLLRHAQRETDGWIAIDAGMVQSTARTPLGGLLGQGGRLRMVPGGEIEWHSDGRTARLPQHGARLLVPHPTVTEAST